jgi:hypothetical protein
MKPRITAGNYGDLLAPPEHPSRRWHIQDGSGNRIAIDRRVHRNPMANIPAEVAADVVAMVCDWERVRLPLTDPLVKEWIARVHKYFISPQTAEIWIQRYYPEYRENG